MFPNLSSSLSALSTDKQDPPCKQCHFSEYAVPGSFQCTICPPGTLGSCPGGCPSPMCDRPCPKGFHCKDSKPTQCRNKDKITDATDTYLDILGGKSQASCKSCDNHCANSTCQDCTHTGACEIFNDHCLVDGICYKNNDLDPSSSCRSCQRDSTHIGRCTEIPVHSFTFTNVAAASINFCFISISCDETPYCTWYSAHGWDDVHAHARH